MHALEKNYILTTEYDLGMKKVFPVIWNSMDEISGH